MKSHLLFLLLFSAVGAFGAAISGSVPVTGPVAPTDTADTYPSHLALYGKGGLRTVADTAARDAIPAARREEGMWVYVASSKTLFQLMADLATWQEVAPAKRVFRAGQSGSWLDGAGNIAFSFPIEFSVFSDRTVSKSVADFYVARDVTYYLNPGGSDSNDGLSPSSPKQSLYNLITAINSGASSGKSGGVRLVLAPGLYSGTSGFSGAAIQFPSTIECTNGQAIIVSGRGGTDWSLASGNIYRRFSHVPARLFDFKYRDADGLPYEMTFDPTNYISNDNLYTNLLAGRWAIYGGATYLRALDDRAVNVDTNTPVVSAMTNLAYLVNLRDFSDSWTNRGTAHYLRNLVLVGNTNTLQASLTTATNAIIAIDSCEFFGNQGTSQGAVYISRDSGGAWIENSVVALSNEDGIEYHGFATNSMPFGVEVNVRSVRNGTDQSSNGSTGHESARIVRINGSYTENFGRAVHDVIGTQAVNLWCYAGLSTDQDDGDDVAFMNGIDGSNDWSVSWYYDCLSAGGGPNHNAFRVSGGAISYIVRGRTGQPSAFRDNGRFKFLR